MNLHHLHYFYVVAREGGFTRASEVLSIQQPAISRMVKMLEEQLGFALFERIGRKVRLTSRGREVYGHAQDIFAKVRDLESQVGHLAGTPQGRLAFGANEAIASHFIPNVLERMLAKFPQLHPAIFTGPANQLFEEIRTGGLEFGLFFHIPHLPPDMKVRVLKMVRFQLVVRKDLRKDKRVLESFIGSREIEDTQTRTFPTLEKLKKRYPNARIQISSNCLTAHRTMVLKGLGVAVLPDFLVADDLKSGQVSDVLPKEDLQFALKLVTRETSVPGLNMQTFLDFGVDCLDYCVG